MTAYRVDLHVTGTIELDETAPSAPPPLPPPDAGSVLWSADFTSRLSDFAIQARSPDRVQVVSTSRGLGVQLTTQPGDNNIAGSGEMERCDLYLAQPGTQDPVVYGEGVEDWWAHSILLPDDFQPPRWHSYVLFDFHNERPGPGQANFMLNFARAPGDDGAPGLLAMQGFGEGTQFGAVIGPPAKNRFYDFVYHVRWSSGADGFFDAWADGRRVLAHRGATLYAGQGVYLKLANYHNPVCDPYPACIGSHAASSVIHQRVLRGTTSLAVSSGPLEGVLELVDGVLRPVIGAVL